VSELPANFGIDCLLRVGSHQAHRFDSVRGRAQSVSTHVADGCCLSSGPCGGSSRRRLNLAGRTAIDKSSADFHGNVQFTASECLGACDGCAWATISGFLGLKQPQDSLGTIGGPRSDKAPVEFAQCLW
jgi:hypothetical protein